MGLKALSTGGLGDAFIALLKIHWCPEITEWTHIESNDISVPLKHIWKMIDWDLETKFIHDPNYIHNIEKYRKESDVIVPIPVQGMCEFHKKEWPLKFSFINRPFKEKDFDIVIQSSAGSNMDRNWNHDILKIAVLLKSTGRHVTIIGSEKPNKNMSTNDILDLRGRTDLSDAFHIIQKSNVFIGLSGLLNYYACASKIPNIHVIESEKHEKLYYNDDWNQYTVGIVGKGLQDVVLGLRLLKEREALK